MRFEWDPRKAAANLRKHRISFEEATTALRDNLAVTGRDSDHSTGEIRYIIFGVSSPGRLLVVAHTERGGLAPSAHVLQRNLSGKSMKKAKPTKRDELRPEYKCSDFGKMVRGKYANRIAAATNVVVLDPEVAHAFPNDGAVNEALRSLINIAKASTRPTRRSRGRAAKAAARP